MRYIAAAVLTLCSTIVSAEDWSSADTYRQAIVTALIAADWAQTRWIATHPRNARDLNPILGEHPSLGKVNAYFATFTVAHAAVSAALPVRYRAPWQYVWIGYEWSAVHRNYLAGMRMNF